MGEYIVSSTCAQVECDEAGDIEKVKQAGLKMVRLSPADNAAAAMIESVKVWADARYRVAHALHGRSDVRQEPSKRADSAPRRRPNPKGA